MSVIRNKGWVAAVFLMFSFSAWAGMDHKYDPVVVRGVDLPTVLGAQIGTLRLFAFNGKNFQQSVYQIDERFENMIYWKRTRLRQELVYTLSEGSKVHPDPNPIFDRDDELAFMAWDLGLKASAGAGPEGSLACQEITVANPEDNNARYAYLCRFDNPPPALDKKYVQISADKTKFIGQSYKIGYPKNSPVFFEELELGSGDNWSPNLIDKFKINYDVGAVWSLFTYNLNNSDVDYRDWGTKVGPVRIIKEMIAITEPWAHIKNRLMQRVYFYPCHMEWEMETRAPINWGTIHNYVYSLAIDMNPNAEGSKFFSDKNPRGVTVDGVTDREELQMNYGPQRWLAMSTKYGTIYNQLDLPVEAKNLYPDLFYGDMTQKMDPPDNYPGMFGKFGYKIKSLERTGRKATDFRMYYFFSPDPYQKGSENQFVKMHSDPLVVKSDGNAGYAVSKNLPFHDEDRPEDSQPGATFAPKIEKKQATKFPLPNILLDAYNTGYGLGISYTDEDFLKSGIGWNISTLFTTRNYYNIGLSIYKLKFIPYVEDFEIDTAIKQFPSETFYGIGDRTTLDQASIFWWTRNEATLKFKKHFAAHYGVNFSIYYKDTKIKSGQQPIEGTQKGKPSFEDHYGYDSEIKGQRWGGPVYGRQGGMTNGFTLDFFRDMRDNTSVPHRGDYEAVSIQRVGPELGSDYDYTRLTVDLRKYFEPAFLQTLPFDEWFASRRSGLAKFINPNKHRNISFRAAAVHTFAREIDYYGQTVLDIPFYEMTALGGGSTNRGFYGNRFRDNDYVVLSAEYRWQYWRFFDIGLFVDTGMVMDNILEQESWDNPWHTAYGVSLRAHIPPGVFMTFEWTWSSDLPGGYFNTANFVF